MKKHGWPELLDEYIQAAQARVFAYGTFDCCLWCADWVSVATGVDHAATLRGYDSMLEAYKIIATYGSIEKMVTQLLGRGPLHAAMAQRGDIVLMRAMGGAGGRIEMDGPPESLGICAGLHSAFPHRRGLIMIRTLEASAAWRVE
jgi:hypothetical protein